MSAKKKNKLTKIQKSIEEVLAPEEDRDIEIEHGDETQAHLFRDSDQEEDYDNDGRDQAFDFAQERSVLRKKNVRPLVETDPKYQGVKKTRKQMQKERGETETLDEKEQKTAEWADLLMIHDDAEEEEDQGSDTDEEQSENGSEEQEQEDDEEPLNHFKNESHDFGQYGSISDEDEDEQDESNDDQEEKDEDERDDASDQENRDASLPAGIQIVSKSNNVQNEIEKGLAIKKQLALSDSLLETRIQMQKILGKVNQFPQPDVWNEFKTEGDENYRKAVKKSQLGLKKLLDGLLELKTSMVNANPDLKRPFAQSESDLDESDDDNSDTVKDLEPCPKKMKLSEYSRLLEERHKALIPYRNETIEKWNDKTRLASGSVNKKSFSGFETSTLKQIEHILTDKSRLVKRTQNKRSSYRILGQPERDTLAGEEAFDPEIFDDDDFYHQLLRELIDRKTADVTDPLLLGKQWLQIQKMRSKMKKKVDTKASKGRKTRYDIHAKLVNFMAPIYTESWKDETKNELFSSLFGKS